MAELPGLAEWLREHVGEERGRQAEIARRAGLHASTLKRIMEATSTRVHRDTQIKLAQAFAMTHAELVAAVTGNRPPPVHECCTPTEAINRDPDLTTKQRRILLSLYADLRGER